MELKNTSPTKTKLKRQKSAGKVVLVEFWNEESLLHMEFLKRGATVNAKHY